MPPPDDENDRFDGAPIDDAFPAPPDPLSPPPPPPLLPPAADPRPGTMTGTARAVRPAADPDEIAAYAPAAIACPANTFRVAPVDGRDVWSVTLSRRFNRLEALNLASWLLAATGAKRSEYEPIVSAIKPNLPKPTAPPTTKK